MRAWFSGTRDTKEAPSRYTNQRHYSQKIVSDSDYIFFALFIIKKTQLNNQINITMKKVVSSTLTAGMISKNFEQSVKQFINKEKAYLFMNTIKSTPVYWKKHG